MLIHNTLLINRPAIFNLYMYFVLTFQVVFFAEQFQMCVHLELFNVMHMALAPYMQYFYMILSIAAVADHIFTTNTVFIV